MILIEGEIGIGRSTLLHAALRLARSHGVVTCEARASSLESAFRYRITRQLFEPVLTTLDWAER